jgi:hypothetical protein
MVCAQDLLGPRLEAWSSERGGLVSIRLQVLHLYVSSWIVRQAD